MAEDPAADKASPNLSEEERQEVFERKAGSSRVLHEVIRREGAEELARSWRALMFSGLVAGVAINASVVARAMIHARLPDAPYRPLIESFGYTLGFIITIMGRMQLFTETTVTAVLPVVASPTGRHLARLGKLWTIVFLANMAGTFVVSLMLDAQWLIDANDHRAILETAAPLLEHGPWKILVMGVPSGFLVGCIAWTLPNARENQIWVILALTYLISLGGFSHIVPGSTETWMLWLAGRTSLANALFGILLPSLVGNIVGGTMLFAVMANGQVRDEVANDG